jgi:TPR repeat protein
MNKGCSDKFERNRPPSSGRPSISGRLRRAFGIVAAATALLISAANFAEAQSFRYGVSAFNRQDYPLASRIFIPLAEQGVPAAQSYLGFMFETGRGVAQNYTEAAMWYRRAAEQGDPSRNIPLVCSMTGDRACRAISSRPANGSISRPRRRPGGRGKRARVFATP